VIAQHMPEYFTASLAQALTIDTGRDVWEGAHHLPLLPNSITLIPGSKDAVVAPLRSGGFELRLVKVEASVHPSADTLFESAALAACAPVGVVLTGMGQDGARGAVALRRKGMPVFVQDPHTCIVNGMPQAAFDAAPGCEVLTIKQIAIRVNALQQPARPGTDVPR
jgi:two-component system chemotaxis response regulator CheB